MSRVGDFPNLVVWNLAIDVWRELDLEHRRPNGIWLESC